MFRHILFLVLASSSLLAQEQQQAYKITPLKPVPQLRAEALAAMPPAETGPSRQPDLVELVKVDPTIKLDIHYASDNNFMGTPFYSQARAFMQKPAAEALVRANAKLHEKGYGLLVFDGYRPWYVTKMFWEGTPPQVTPTLPILPKVRSTTADAPLISPLTTCEPVSRSTCPVVTTRCRNALTPTTLAAPRNRMPTARCYVRRWRPRASP